MFAELDDKLKEQILFFIRSELAIDGIPLTIIDLEETLDGTLSARELLSRLLFNEGDWNKTFKDAEQASLDFETLEEILLKDVKFSLSTITCNNCNWRGEPEELEVEIVNEELNTSDTYCPDCGKILRYEKDEKENK